ncbi:hypothetical protein [Flavobacterium chungangensis]|uniref:Uncharacterized protein n=1 Tax=Flavobacterium chungangensis TaxID=2708132 RepID=A0ABV8ZE44_9FLAO
MEEENKNPLEENIKKPRKPGSGGKRVGAGRRTQRETESLIAKLSPYQDEVIEVLLELCRKKDVQAVKLYLAYLNGNPTTTTNSTVTANVTSIDLREIITFSEPESEDDSDDVES